MYAANRTLTLMSSGHGASVERGASASALHASGGDAHSVDSNALLQGHRAVEIKHNGAVYRLQATKLGKLILTK